MKKLKRNEQRRQEQAMLHVLMNPSARGLRYLLKKGYLSNPGNVVPSDEGALGAIHKVRLLHKKIPAAMKVESANWLKEHGFNLTIDERNLGQFPKEIVEWLKFNGYVKKAK